LPTADANETANHVVSLVTTRLPNYTKTDMREIQVLSPMKIGPAGVENLNKLLQQQINPYQKGKNQINVGNTIFREGDKVMQTQNDYEIEWARKIDRAIEFGQGVFNGDIGYVTKVNVPEGFLEVTFDDGRVTQYNRSEMSSLMLAYAITVHKSQGCEFDVVVIPLYGGAPTIINKNLLYTAVTRAKKYVVLVGSKKYISVMIHNNFIISRNTMLKHFLSREQAKYNSLYGEF
jgi:exodeoxyribonuclease V alpha subunit